MADLALNIFRRLMTLPIASAIVLMAYAQSAYSPPPGDPQVLHIYLRQAHRFISDLAQGRSATSSEATAIRLRVDIGNLAVLERVHQSAISAIDALDAEGRAYVREAASKKQPRDMAKLREFDRRRTQVLEQAKAQLRNALGEAGWLRLQAYLDGEFRLHVKRRGL